MKDHLKARIALVRAMIDRVSALPAPPEPTIWDTEHESYAQHQARRDAWKTLEAVALQHRLLSHYAALRDALLAEQREAQARQRDSCPGSGARLLRARVTGDKLVLDRRRYANGSYKARKMHLRPILAELRYTPPPRMGGTGRRLALYPWAAGIGAKSERTAQAVWRALTQEIKDYEKAWANVGKKPRKASRPQAR